MESVWSEQELVRRCERGIGGGVCGAGSPAPAAPAQPCVPFDEQPRDTAEDVVQETFLAAFRGMERFTPRPSLAAWITTICVRLAGRAGQRRSATRAASLDQLVELGSPVEVNALFGQTSGDGRDPHAVAEASELRQALMSAIAGLPYKQRAAVVLRFVSGLDYAEAAQALDVPLNTYKSHLLRGTRQLRDVLQPLTLRPFDEATHPDVRTGGPDGGGPIDRASWAAPVVDNPTMAAPDGTRPDRAVPVAAASRRSARSTPMPEDSSL